MPIFALLIATSTFCAWSQTELADWVSFVNSGITLPTPQWGMFGGYDETNNKTYIIGGIQGTSYYYDDDNYWFYSYLDSWYEEEGWEYSNRIVIHDFSTSQVAELGTSAAMSFGSLVSSSVTIDDTIYFMTGVECNIDGITNCKNTTRLHSYNIIKNEFIYDVLGSVPIQDDYDATICWNYNYNNPYIFVFNNVKFFQYINIDDGEWIVWKNTTVPRRGSVCFFDDIMEALWTYGGYAHPTSLETLYFKPNSSSFYMNEWKLKPFMSADNSYFNRQFVRADSQLFYFFGGMQFNNFNVYASYYYYISGIDTSSNHFFNTYIPINTNYQGLVGLLPIALSNWNNDVYIYGGYNGYTGFDLITQSSQNYPDDDYYMDDYMDGNWGDGGNHKRSDNIANIVVFSIVGVIILIIIIGYCYKYKVKQKRDEVNRMNAITNSLNVNSNETADSKIMFSDNVNQDDTMYGLLNDNMTNNQETPSTNNNNNDNGELNVEDNNNNNIDKEQLVYMPPDTNDNDNIESNDIDNYNTGDTEEDAIEDIHEEPE